MLGETGQFSPRDFLRSTYPDVDVRTTQLPGRLQGCVDLERRIVWLAEGLTHVEERCVLAYEIGQLIRGPLPEDPVVAAAHRRDAEDWAARMLISTEALVDGFSLFRRLPEIAEWLEVDLPTLRARLRGLTDHEQDAAMEALGRQQPSAA